MEVNITDERPELDLIITEENQEFDVQISDDGQDVTVNIDDESNEVLIEISDEETPTKITIEESHGLSAYQLYLATTTANPPLSLKDWLDSLGGGSATQYIDSQISDVKSQISYVEYSFDKINWHSNVWVTDIWMRQKIGKNGVWSEPFLIKGMDALNITVWSEYGNSFINGDISTTLVATVFKGAEDITDSIPSNRFNWIRQSANPAGDSVWNSLHKAKGKFIDITDEDVSRSAIFLVEIDIPEELLF